MKKIYFVRHGQTDYNNKNLVQDGTTTLSVEGQKQAIKVAERLVNVNFQHLVVSDYVRTKQTAEPIAKLCNINPQYNPLFRELRRPSKFFHQSRETDEYKKYQKEEYENFAVDSNWRHSDEENFADVLIRAKKALMFLASLEGDAAVVSHGHFIRIITAMVATNRELDAPTWQKMYHCFSAVNTGITTLLFDPEENHWKILTFNDIAHFAE